MKRLMRSRSDRLAGGVCGGVARYYGISADLVRLLWIVALVLGGLGVLPYVAALFLLPESDEPKGPPVPAAKAAGFALLGLGVAMFFRNFDARILDPTVLAFWRIRTLGPLVLLVCGAVLVWPASRGFLGTSGRRPERSLSDRVLSGVAGGLARLWGVDSNLVRLVFVAAASLTAGLAVLAYLLLVLVLPEEAVPVPGVTVPPPPAGPSGDAGSGRPDQAVSGGGR